MGREKNTKSQFFPNRVVWWLGLATRLSREFKSRANGLPSLGLLSCSATVDMTLQLPCMLHTCANFGGLPVMSHPRVPVVSLCILAQSWAFLHTLSLITLTWFLTHYPYMISQSLHDSHLNTGLLIAKIQANLTRNKANKMVDKIQPYRFVHVSCFTLLIDLYLWGYSLYASLFYVMWNQEVIFVLLVFSTHTFMYLLSVSGNIQVVLVVLLSTLATDR